MSRYREPGLGNQSYLSELHRLLLCRQYLGNLQVHQYAQARCEPVALNGLEYFSCTKQSFQS